MQVSVDKQQLRVREAEGAVANIQEETRKERIELEVCPLIDALCSTAACTAGTLHAACLPLLWWRLKAACMCIWLPDQALPGTNCLEHSICHLQLGYCHPCSHLFLLQQLVACLTELAHTVLTRRCADRANCCLPPQYTSVSCMYQGY